MEISGNILKKIVEYQNIQFKHDSPTKLCFLTYKFVAKKAYKRTKQIKLQKYPSYVAKFVFHYLKQGIIDKKLEL